MISINEVQKAAQAIIEEDTILKIGKHNDIPDDKFDIKELEIGIKIEMEHTNSKEVAKSIAKDHLSEISDYYTRLVKMEKDAEK